MNNENERKKELPTNIEETQIRLEEWKTVINTQMHFNEMIIRARTMGVSVVIAVYGAAAFAFGQYPDRFLIIHGYKMHVSAVIIIFGIFFLGSIFSIDFFYYYRLLLASVKQGEKIDQAYRDRTIDGSDLFGLTTTISKNVSGCRARAVLIVFYGLPLLVGIFSLIYLFCFYCQ